MGPAFGSSGRPNLSGYPPRAAPAPNLFTTASTSSWSRRGRRVQITGSAFAGFGNIERDQLRHEIGAKDLAVSEMTLQMQQRSDIPRRRLPRSRRLPQSRRQLPLSPARKSEDGVFRNPKEMESLRIIDADLTAKMITLHSLGEQDPIIIKFIAEANACDCSSFNPPQSATLLLLVCPASRRSVWLRRVA